MLLAIVVRLRSTGRDSGRGGCRGHETRQQAIDCVCVPCVLCMCVCVLVVDLRGMMIC